MSGQWLCLLAEGDIGAPIFTSTNTSVRLAYFHTNRILFGLYNRKWKYFKEKTTATLKSKQTSIANVRNHFRTLASSPTPLIFHWSLPYRRKVGILVLLSLFQCTVTRTVETARGCVSLKKYKSQSKALEVTVNSKDISLDFVQEFGL